MSVLEGREPQAVLHYFEEICAIPHGSGNTRQISDYLAAFAKAHGLFCVQDASNNIIIKKPASAGYESAPTVIIQGHMDMVCQQDPSISHIDMEKDGLELIVEGDWLRANGTTLGGDDGIAVAYALAILADDSIPHPALEVLITVDEEIGLLGAASVDLSSLEGKLLLNLDSENDDSFTAGCAGGLTTELTLPVTREPANGTAVAITIDGLLGGHSGGMIDKGRGNADILMGRFLNHLAKRTDYRLAALEGGQKDNAIPLCCDAVVVTDDANAVLEEAARYQTVLAREYAASDAGVRVTAKEVPAVSSMLTEDSTRRAVALLVNVPNGVQEMSHEIEGLVQTSLNLGILRLSDDQLCLSFGVRSSISTQKTALYERMENLAALVGASIAGSGEYPAWEYRKESRLRDICCEAYREQYGKEVRIDVIHAGLECGLFSEKIPGLDAISFGPEMDAIHTVKERLNLPSVERCYRLMLSILKKMKEF